MTSIETDTCHWCGMEIWRAPRGWTHTHSNMFQCDDEEHGAQPKPR